MNYFKDNLYAKKIMEDLLFGGNGDFFNLLQYKKYIIVLNVINTNVCSALENICKQKQDNFDLLLKQCFLLGQDFYDEKIIGTKKIKFTATKNIAIILKNVISIAEETIIKYKFAKSKLSNKQLNFCFEQILRVEKNCLCELKQLQKEFDLPQIN